MTRHPIRSGILWCIASLMLLAGCSPDRSAGGGGFEGETVAISGSVQHEGDLLAGATVSFVALGSRTLLQQTKTDTHGGFTLRIPKETHGFVEARSGDTALARQLIETVSDVPLALDAVRATTWTARAILANGLPAAGASLYVVGSSAKIPCDSTGRFTTIRMGSGREWATVELADGTGRDVLLPSVSDSLLVLADHSWVVFDDFEGSDPRTALGDAIGSGWWFALTDTASGGTSVAVPANALSDIRAAFSTSDAYSGTSLSIQFIVDQTRPVHYAIVGTVISNDGFWIDLSSLDSITFMAKGSGTARLELVTRTNLEPTPDTLGYFGVEFPLPSSWTRMVVRKGDIVAAAGSRPALEGIGWQEASKRMRNISLSVKQSATIQLDDIALHGPRLSDLAQSR